MQVLKEEGPTFLAGALAGPGQGYTVLPGHPSVDRFPFLPHNMKVPGLNPGVNRVFL